jgi:putative membrane protein
MSRIVSCAAVLLLTTVELGVAADAPAHEVNAATLTSETFVKTAAQDGMFEVEAGKLASENGTKSEVKEFGQRMVTDHTKANNQLKKIATDKKIEVPAKLDAKHTGKLTALKAKSGDAFDQAYVADMVEGHQKAVALFTAAGSAPGVDPELKSFAQETLPTLTDHKSKVMQLHDHH